MSLFRASARRPAASSIEFLEARIAPAAANLNLSALNGVNGFKLSGGATADYSGFAVSGAGDVNGDGFADVIVGAIGADPNGATSGASYVVFGKAGGFPANLNLATLDGTDGFRISGVTSGDDSGIAVSAGGDINHDGFDDLLIGAQRASPNGLFSGAAYVVFGKAGGFAANLDLSTLDGNNGFKLSGGASGDDAGFSLSAAGDVNGDGFADIVIGAPTASPHGTFSGAAYVVFGKASGFAANLNLSTLDGNNGFKLSGVAANDYTGHSVSGAGDVNGDGFDDIIIGAPHIAAHNTNSGASYVVFGKASGFAANLDLSTLNGTNGFKLSGVTAGGESGFSVSSAGDINDDGYADVIIGAGQTSTTNDTHPGTSYVVFGAASGFAANLDLSTLNGSNGFALSGDDAVLVVSGAGDFNGDGVPDLIVGALHADPHGSDSGASYVIFGGGGGFFPADVKLSALNGTDGFKISGVAANDFAGCSVHAAGDVNHDGFDDVIIGAYGADPNGLTSGASYVVFGFNSNITTSPNGKTTTLPDSDGDIVTIKTNVHLVPQDIHLAGDGSIALIDLTSTQDQMAKTANTGGGLVKGVVLSVSAHRLKHGSGDGVVNVGAIDATDMSLATVKVTGSLGNITAGTGLEGGRAVQALQVGALIGDADVAGTLGTLKVKHDVKGVLNVTGGPLVETGLTEVSQVFINKVVIGGDIDGSAGGTKAGLLRVRGGIGSVVVKGSVIGGADLSGIVIGGRVSKILIGGDLTSADPAKPVTINALGQIGATSLKKAVAITVLDIGGSVLNAQILAGYKRDLTPLNPDAGIGQIVVQGNWGASSVAAGVEDSTHDGFGQNDTLIPGDTTPTLLSRIASIVITGTATGSAATGDFFGITAQQIGSAKIHRTHLGSGTTPDDIDLDPVNNDFRLVEV